MSGTLWSAPLFLFLSSACNSEIGSIEICRSVLRVVLLFLLRTKDKPPPTFERAAWEAAPSEGVKGKIQLAEQARLHSYQRRSVNAPLTLAYK
jgi:hypothetical protein